MPPGGWAFRPMTERPSVYDLIMNNGRKAVEETDGRHHEVGRTSTDTLDHVDLSGAEVELVEAEGRENRLKEALSPVVGRITISF